MKKQLQKFLSGNYGRLLMLAMMIFIGQGIAFSQGTITVTANTDAGAGSLRQAIADAVDGDVITFDGAITTITLESSLVMGDKTLTIDGGGDVVVSRDLVDVDSFRLVTITGVLDKLVTITDITLQNGISKEDGGGLYANNSTGGKTILDGVVFKNNTAIYSGGGAFIEGLNSYENVVINCEFIENKALHITLGRGGALFPINSTISASTFTDNECGDSGGAIMSGNDVVINDSHFSGNKTLDDSGGAIRVQGNNSTVSNCTFESNSSNRVGGAVFLAKGDIYDCIFINNSSIGGGGGVFSNNVTNIYNSTFIGNSTEELGGAIYMDDNAVISNCVVMNNRATINGGGVYLLGAKGAATLVGSLVAHNTSDSIGGGVYAGTANVINTTITKNFAAENGGALSGDGAWLLANSIVYDNDAAGTDKNIQVISNTAATAATNCAIDETAYNAAGWAASNITTLSASPFVGGTGADSLMLPYSSPLIDIGSMDAAITDLLPATALNGVNRIINSVVDLGPYERLQSFVVTTNADDGAGSLRQIIADAVDGESIITFADGITTIKVGLPLELGDKTLIIDGGGDVILDGALTGAVETDVERVITITGVADKEVTIQNLTIQNGNAADGNGGGLSADHSAGGKTNLENVVFDNNMAFRNGGGLYIAGMSGNPSAITNCEFSNNYVDNGSGEGDGGGMWGSFSVVSGCAFTDNEAMDDAGGAYADDALEIHNSTFTGNIAGGSGGAVRSQDARVVLSGCMFDSNSSADEGAGAVYLARGSMYDCDIINNTTTGDGGGVYANQNECLLDNCLISGNTAAGVGGGAYIDDGGVLSNCVVTNNTSNTNGGGLYLLGANAPALSVGCVIANNTATAQGGGLYVVSANVINSIVTENIAGTNGGALTGETGPWFIGNSIVWDNDATGTDKNIEIVSNSATDHAANSAIDATAYNATWTATNITMLNASPFVGGTGADSLYTLPSAGLIDAGTLEYGIAALLPEFDLDGNDRIQGTIDLGVYETEVISVLGVSLNAASLDINVGGTGELVATIDPAEAGNKTVTWSSSDEGVATVADGVVTGVSAGSATITVTTVDGGFTATSDVTVSIAVTGVTLDQTAVTLEVNETVTLVATVEPANATNQTVGWVSENESVATVNNSGLVTAVAPGTATITVITMDGSKVATCQVTVNESTVAVTGVSLDQTTLALEPGGTGTLVATVAPGDATDKSVSWTSSDAAVATVADGVVTAVADGTCTITVTTTDGGHTATCAVTVKSVGVEPYETGFKLYPNPVSGGKLYIEVSDPGIKAFEIYNVLGVVIHQEKVNIQKNYELDTPDMMKSGIYFIRMIKDQTITVEQFIVE